MRLRLSAPAHRTGIERIRISGEGRGLRAKEKNTLTIAICKKPSDNEQKLLSAHALLIVSLEVGGGLSSPFPSALGPRHC